MRQPEIDDHKEQVMLSAAIALSVLTDSMVHELPEHVQNKLAGLLTTGARLVVHATMTPFPSFLLLVQPADPEAPGIEIVHCSPSADSVRLLQSGPVAH